MGPLALAEIATVTEQTEKAKQEETSRGHRHSLTDRSPLGRAAQKQTTLMNAHSTKYRERFVKTNLEYCTSTVWQFN